MNVPFLVMLVCEHAVIVTHEDFTRQAIGETGEVKSLACVAAVQGIPAPNGDDLIRARPQAEHDQRAGRDGRDRVSAALRSRPGVRFDQHGDRLTVARTDGIESARLDDFRVVAHDTVVNDPAAVTWVGMTRFEMFKT